MHCISITYSETRDVTTVKFSDKFDETHLILRLDVLQDALRELQAEYDRVYELHYKDMRHGDFVAATLGHEPPKQVSDEQASTDNEAPLQVWNIGTVYKTH
jgi:hypothetical protein